MGIKINQNEYLSLSVDKNPNMINKPTIIDIENADLRVDRAFSKAFCVICVLESMGNVWERKFKDDRDQLEDHCVIRKSKFLLCLNDKGINTFAAFGRYCT